MADAGRDSGPASDLLLNQNAAIQTLVPVARLFGNSRSTTIFVVEVSNRYALASSLGVSPT